MKVLLTTVPGLAVIAVIAVIVGMTSCTTVSKYPEGLWYGAITPEDGVVDAISVSVRGQEVMAFGGKSTVAGDRWSVEYPSGAVFQGVLPQQGRVLSGFYVQPGNNIGGQRLAHFLQLELAENGRWTGTPTPLVRQFSMFVDVEENAQDGVVATLMNPERNMTGPSRRYSLLQSEDGTFPLISPPNEQAFTALERSPKNNVLSMAFGPVENFQLNRIKRSGPLAQRFYGDSKGVKLDKPPVEGAWTTDLPASVGMDEDKLTGLLKDLASESALNNSRNLVDSLLVARNGKLVVDAYFRGYDRQTPHDIRSAGKTVASVLVGALRQHGHDLAMDTPINRFIPMAGQPDTRPVSLGDLLTHRSGIECDDSNGNSKGNENSMWNQGDYDNFWSFAAGLSQATEPGTRYSYCSAGINLVGAALSGVSGQSVLSLLQTHLFGPLGFKSAYWNTMPNNEAYLGGGAHIRPRDFLKIGQLYLNEGRWNGVQLIDREWIKQSLMPQVEITPASTGLSEERFNQWYFGGRDGLAWHLHTITVQGREYQTMEASGNGGQMVVIVPELDLAVAITGANYGQGYIWGKWRQNIIGDRIIAAIR